MRENKYTVSADAISGEAHVWYCSPDDITNDERLTYYQSLLSVDEAIQHQRFQFQSDQHTYLVSHALVRTVLSKYTDVKPDQWEFKKNSHGRPDIYQQSNGEQLKFNLTHTKGLCACVVTLGFECGIDAELINRKNNLSKIAERMFSDYEIHAMRNLQESEFRKTFFKYWTLRESYVKALGTGLGGSSKDFYFNIDDNAAVINFENEFGKGDKTNWQFSIHAPTNNHISAIALRNETKQKINIIESKIIP